MTKLGKEAGLKSFEQVTSPAQVGYYQKKLVIGDYTEKMFA